MVRNKKIIILGASSDIGVETVKLFLNNNFTVLAHYNKNKKDLTKIKSKKLTNFRPKKFLYVKLILLIY